MDIAIRNRNLSLGKYETSFMGICCCFLCYSSIVFAERQDILLNNQWKFRFSHQVQKGTEVRVDLPHTWNAQDALSGKIDYKRGIGNYEKKLFVQSQWKGNVSFTF